MRYSWVLALLLAACDRSSPKTADTSAADAGAGDSIRYLALGDSFTIGTGSTPEQAFPARLSERWRGKGCTVTLKNLGVNGYTTDNLTERELPEVAPFKPTIVTLAIGANDRVHGEPIDVYRAHVKAILKSIVDAGVPANHIVTLPQPDWSLSPVAARFGDPAALGADIIAFNGVLKDEATQIGARYIDLFPLMHQQAEQKMIAKDGLHPNADAHDAWAEELSKQMP